MPTSHRKVYVHLMSADAKEEMKFDETQPVKGLFADIEEQASAGLKERITASTGPMLLLYNGQQLATSAEQTADKERRPLRDVPCWPKEPDSEHIPILQLYVPKRYSDVDKPADTNAKPASSTNRECCTVL
eukprot:Rhum_TRINITY_DN2791_c0_g2::Rhum_TRINITY_DN2791_c0_g2_i1::g.7991::m.7991